MEGSSERRRTSAKVEKNQTKKWGVMNRHSSKFIKECQQISQKLMDILHLSLVILNSREFQTGMGGSLPWGARGHGPRIILEFMKKI